MVTTADQPTAIVGPSVGVVICAYTDQRWDDLLAAIRAVDAMTGSQDHLVVVIDHNDDLALRLRQVAPERVSIVPNSGVRGLSDARNSGVAALATDVVAFLDDDALPEAGWLEALRAQFTSPQVAAVGGAIEPRWDGGRPPRWFPEEFGWVVGCDYRGLPGDGQQIRNPIGASMAVRRSRILDAGGFSTSIGRIGERPMGNEETELGIRIRQSDPGALILRATGAVVGHRVPPSRQTMRYFVSRCYHEGLSKAALSTSVGARDGLSSETSYVMRTLVSGFLLHARAGLLGQPSGFARAGMLPVGLGTTAWGYLVGRLRAARFAAPQ